MVSSRTIQVGEVLELEIDSLSYGGGRGVGRFDGFVVFVPYSAPGDSLRVKVSGAKKSFLEADILEILKPSSHRRDPPCPVFGECGGCSIQHVLYESQLFEKQRYIERALHGKTKSLKPIYPSKMEFNYRNRIQLQRTGKALGFLRRGSNQIVPIQECFIADPKINAAIRDQGVWSDLQEDRIELALAQDGKVVVRAKGVPEPEQALFSQVNTLQNDVLVRTIVEGALELCKQNKIINFIDLYAGSGNLTFPVYQATGLPGVGVELSRTSVDLAKVQVKQQELEASLSFTCSSVEQYLKNAGPSPQALFVMDPPREGLTAKVIAQLKRLAPPAILLVGCHLMNFARDLGRLKELGYEVLEVQPIDMFPQTDHVELVGRLSKILK